MDKQNNTKDYYWRCTVCGHEVNTEKIPMDYICPICGAYAPKFERVDRNEEKK